MLISLLLWKNSTLSNTKTNKMCLKSLFWCTDASYESIELFYCFWWPYIFQGFFPTWTAELWYYIISNLNFLQTFEISLKFFLYFLNPWHYSPPLTIHKLKLSLCSYIIPFFFFFKLGTLFYRFYHKFKQKMIKTQIDFDRNLTKTNVFRFSFL